MKLKKLLLLVRLSRCLDWEPLLLRLLSVRLWLSISFNFGLSILIKISLKICLRLYFYWNYGNYITSTFFKIVVIFSVTRFDPGDISENQIITLFSSSLFVQWAWMRDVTKIQTSSAPVSKVYFLWCSCLCSAILLSNWNNFSLILFIFFMPLTRFIIRFRFSSNYESLTPSLMTFPAH